MLITAIIGLCCNLIMMNMLHERPEGAGKIGGHGHSHDGGNAHGAHGGGEKHEAHEHGTGPGQHGAHDDEGHEEGHEHGDGPG